MISGAPGCQSFLETVSLANCRISDRLRQGKAIKQLADKVVASLNLFSRPEGPQVETARRPEFSPLLEAYLQEIAVYSR